MKKIIYINGSIEENSTKPQKLSQILNEEVEHLKLTFNEGRINEQELDEYFEKEHKIIKYIIGASIGSYIARYYAHKYSLPLISLNPVVEIENTFSLLKLSDKFKALNNLLVKNLIFVNKDDKLIDFKQTYKYFNKKSKIILFDKGGHQFDNLNDIKRKHIKNFFKIKETYTFDRWKIKDNMSSWSFKIFKKQNKELTDMYIAHILAQTSLDENKIENNEHEEYSNNFKNFQSWKNSFNQLDNWIKLNAIIAMSSILEMYMIRIIQLALHSDMKLWNEDTRDGIKLHKEGKHKNEGNTKADKATSGQWSRRINNFEEIFQEIPKIFEIKKNMLEDIRKIRNNIGHSFGANLDNSKKQYDDLIPLEIIKLEHNDIIKYLKLTYSVARDIDKQLMKNHIGTYQYLKFYHELRKNKLELKDKEVYIQAQILKKEIAKKGYISSEKNSIDNSIEKKENKNKPTKIDLFGHDFYMNLIKYYNNL